METAQILEQPVPVANPPAAQQVKEPDLLTRVSQYKVAEPSVNKESHAIETPDIGFDAKKEIESIKDPIQKSIVEKTYKNLVSGFNNKYQELAKQRKEIEALKAQAEQSKQPSQWTVERLQAELNKPDFVQAANQIMGSQKDGMIEDNAEFSSLSESEKAKLKVMEQELLTMKQQAALVAKQNFDNQIKSRYPNYNPEAIDTLTSDILAGKVQITREHVFKAHDYESAIDRAYRLGMEDAKKEKLEKQNGQSFDAGSTTIRSTGTQVEQIKGESSQNFFKRIALENLKKRMNGELK